LKTIPGEKKVEFHHHCADETVLQKIPEDKYVAGVAELFQLISDPSRLKILWLLCHCELCVNNIGVAVNMSSPAVSHHLRLLKQAQLIESRRKGKEMYYKLAQTPEAALLHKSIDDIFDIQCPNQNN